MELSVSTGLTIIFFLSLLSTDGFVDKEHWSLACYVLVLTITSICAQYIKYSDNNYLGVSLVRSIFIIIPLDHVPTYLGPSILLPTEKSEYLVCLQLQKKEKRKKKERE